MKTHTSHSVYVSTRPNANPLNSDLWLLYASTYTDQYEALGAVHRALNSGHYQSARIVTETTFYA